MPAQSPSPCAPAARPPGQCWRPWLGWLRWLGWAGLWLCALLWLASASQATPMRPPAAALASAPDAHTPAISPGALPDPAAPSPWDAALAESGIGLGVLESVTLTPERTLVLKGWAVSAQPNAFITLAHVWLGEQPLYTGRLGLLYPRPDVARATGHPEWLHVGFELPIALPALWPERLPSGPATLRVHIQRGDGAQFALRGDPGVFQLDLPPANAPAPAARWLLALALLAPLLALALPSGIRSARLLPPARQRALFGGSLLLSLALLVAGGWTGSSLALLLQHAPVTHDMRPYLGVAQTARTDEWLVVTPLAISQTTQPEPMAAINPLHGLHGQNMNVVGMTGAPVANLAALAKPATWGFFFLDLRRALAWDWWLPYFLCLGALWLLLQRWLGTPWRWAAVLAATYTFSPYSVSFSGWPAYLTGFAVVGLLAADRLWLRRSHAAHAPHAASSATPLWAAAGWGLLLGWAAAGFVLVLYPGWQIALAYLLAPLALAWFWHSRQRRGWGSAQWLGLLCAALVAQALLGAWWLDGQAAIEAMRTSVYPGQRSTEVGGYADPWALAKGMGNFITMFQSSLWAIPSDSGSFLYVLLPLLAATLAMCLPAGQRVLHAHMHRPALLAALWAYVGFALLFMFVGLPAWLSEASLWARVPVIRLDAALGLAQTLLLAWWVGAQHRPDHLPSAALSNATLSGTASAAPWPLGLRALALASGLGLAAWLWWLHTRMLAPLQAWQTAGATALMVALAGLLGALLIGPRWRIAIALYALWTLAAALPFNPIGQAPTYVRVADALAPWLAPADASGPPARVAVVRENRWANALSAAGVAVLNTTFYEPPLRFWQQLDPGGAAARQYHRYQHLRILLAEPQELAAGAAFSIFAPTLDHVDLRIHAQRMDFSLLGVSHVLSNAADAAHLRQNPSLQLLTQEGDWHLFAVQPGG
ncbi:hypothetical protein EBQ26_12220 [Allofranklinella schreckenbergeri]|uniref:Uncharacterized protein n=1 Tax=Allofranklinella schreckenbergeri TaxID=1076744 RepID=A0A3M6PWW8_9BURK|nr:hypothetical protein [Allofranklinella schreckenbergeri]RMW94618.1 hypothetical protein EBQ26_12220 [Allofranklinella schreckenbergeri]